MTESLLSTNEDAVLVYVCPGPKLQRKYSMEEAGI